MLLNNHAGVRPVNICVSSGFVASVFIFLSAFALSFIGIDDAPPPAPGVVAELRFNEGTGTTAADGSGNNHNGTLTNGPTWGAGRYGQGINLDGTNDYVNIADHANFTLTPTQSYTWSGWVRNNNFNQWSTIWSQTINTTNFFYFYAHSSNDGEAGPVTNGVSVYWYSGTNKLVLHSNNNVLTAGQWSYVAITYNSAVAQASRFTIYINGVDVTNRTDVVSTGTIAAIDPTNTRIGSNQPFGEYLNGSVDEVRYYRRLLSVAEIQADMNIGGSTDAQAPTVSLTAPAAGNVSGTINVNANAADNVGVTGVQFLLDGNALGAEDIAAPYTVSWNTTTATNGNHSLTARARDAAGNTTTSAAVAVNVNNDTQAPTVSLTAPAAGNVQGTINVNANAADNVGVTGVQFLLDGNALGTEDLAAPYTVSWNTTTATNGNHSLTARARDAAGNTTTSTAVVVNVNNPDAVFPTVSLTAPGAGNVVGTINVNANAADNIGVVGVQFLLDGNALGAEDLAAPYTVSWNTTTTTNGNHSLTARARDAAGNTTTSAAVAVNVNNDIQAPTVSLTAPAAGNVQGTINVSATSSDNVGVAGVQFLLDGNALGAEDLTAPYTISWNTTTTTNGSHNLSARARDAAGNTTVSAVVVVNVLNDAQAPTVSLTEPAAGSVQGTINVDANAADNIGVVGVQFLLDGNVLGAEDLTAPYTVSWNTTTTTNGSHNLSARAKDAAGNTTTSTVVIVNVNNPDAVFPTVSLTAPAAGNVVGTINVNANAADNIGVVGVQFLLDGNALGAEDLAAPYTVSWNTTTATNGSHSLSARARDAVGNTTTSTVVVVNVNNDTQAPTVTVTAPATSPVSGTITVAATASDNVGVVGVQFLLNGNNLGTEDLTAPYSVSWNTTTATNSTHNITARARDVAGNITTSPIVAFTVLNNNLVASYGFNENTGTTANDNSGNNNHGTLTSGPIWNASGRFGAAIQFDGTNDLVNINDANSLDLTNGMTLEAWVNPTNVTGYKTVICKERTTNAYTYTMAANNSTSGTANQRPNSRIRTGSTNKTVTGTTKLALNTWTHLATTYDGATFRYYVNGVQVATLAATGNMTVTTNLLRIGGSPNLGTQYFAGRIDEVRIYNRALSQAEIQTDMNTPIAPDITNPTVNITAPAAGNVSGNINVTANATDNISVAGVQFLLDGNALGAEDLTAPYSVPWNTISVPNGPHTLTAVARDAAGNTTTSAGVNVNVNNDEEPPAITITSPTAGTIDGTVTVSADATDNVGVAGVQFIINGNVNLGSEDVTFPYSIQWNTTNYTDGNYTLMARVRDAAGNTTTSSTIVINILNHPPDIDFPTVNITAPSAGDVSGTINVTANASDNVGVIGVQFLINGNPLGAEDIAAPYSISWNTDDVPNGNYTLTARARDAAGNIATSAEVIVNVNNLPDAIPPTVNISGSAAGTISGIVNLTATAADNVGVVGVQFLLDGNPLGAEDLTAPYSFSWNTTTTTNGNHTISARARDAEGNMTTSDGVVFNVNNDTQAPTVSLTAPAAGSVQGTINVSANATDNIGIVGVQFLLEGNALGAEDTGAPYTISWSTATTTNGNHSLTARARDAAGNITTSAAVNVTVSNTATNLIAALGLNEGTGTASADISGNNHNGTLTSGAGWTAGRYGQGVTLNGSTNYINIADHNNFTLDPAQNYTWSAWVRNTNFTEWSTVWSQTINSANFFYFYAHTSTDPDGGPVTNGVSVYWWVNNGASRIGAHSSNNVLTAGQWSHIAVTYNASQPQNNRFSIYVNGVDVTVRNDVSSVGTITAINPTNIRIGSNQAFGEYLNGAVDEVRYYNRLLALAEIQSDMNTPIGNVTDAQPPVVSLTAPAEGNVQGTINVSANATDNISVVGVQFLLDGNPLGAEDLTAPYSISWNTTTVTNGNHNLTARARDAAGNTTTSAAVAVNVNNDTQAPVISLTAPAAGNVLGTISVTANASDNVGVVGVQFLLNGNALGAEDLTAPYSISWNTTTVTDGPYTLTARARDAAGNTTTSIQVSVTVQNNPPDTEDPTVSVTGPAAGDVSGTINVTASAGDNVGVTGVQFLLNGSPLGAEDLTAPYSISWNTNSATNGNYTLTARARDAGGNTTTSAGVLVNVNNIPDTEDPTVSITSPSAGNVSGTINVNANAGDNVGVVGVQFLLDGANLGAEDLTAPYSISWNTGLTTNGPHVVSARARDATGNTTTAVNINVIVNNSNPVISNISVTAITISSAVINWTTNVPTNSQVNFGTTTSYNLSTLLDEALVTSHSMILQGLNPSTLYNYQIRSEDANETLVTSVNLTFTTTALSSSPGNLNGRPVVASPAGMIIPWTPNPGEGYHTVMGLSWNYLISGVPNDPSTGKPAYYSRSLLDPSNGSVVNWPHNPAGLYAMLIESALKYYHYSANTNVMQIANDVAIWHLDHGMTTPTDNWPSVPYASGDAGSLTYDGAVAGNASGQGDGEGFLQPDKIGELGNGFLQLYKYGGNTRYRDAAIQAANVLASKVRTGTVSQSPWPFRVNAHTGAIREDYCAHVIAPITLFDGMIASGLGDTAAYRTARNIAWNWMMNFPMQNNNWAQYFEDVPVQPVFNNNKNQLVALQTARYLMEHPEMDPNWETHVRGIISWTESLFGQASFGATAVKEQTPVFAFVMGSHTSRYGSVCAMLYEKTGDLVAKEKAYRALNWATYMARNNGVVIDGPDVNTQWFTDGYGDYVRHFMTGIGAIPEWSPANQTHMVRTTSVVKSITYGTNSVSYTTADANSIEVLHVNFTPVTVTANGVALSKRTDLNQPGWTLDVATKTLRIYHTGATQIEISSVPQSALVFNTNNVEHKPLLPATIMNAPK